MKNIFIGILIVVVFAGAAAVAEADGGSTTVQFTVPSGDIGVPISGPDPFDFFSSALNGTTVTGQTLSLNLVLSNNVLTRVFETDGNTFAVVLVIYTNDGTLTGFPGPSSGFLLSPSGNQFGDTIAAGRGEIQSPLDGEGFFVGLSGFNPSNLDGESTFDISGVHFDITLPNDGSVVTNAMFVISPDSYDDRVEFGTAKQLPEPSTLGLTLMGLLSVIGLAAWRRAPEGPVI